MKNKKRFPATNIGTVSLLMIFIVLCMSIFAVLSLSESVRDYRFSQTLADHTTQYYEASGRAEETLAAIDARLLEEGSDADFSDLDVTETEDSGSRLLSWQAAMNEDQAVSVTLRITESGLPRYEILSWQEIQTSDWEADTTLFLMQ